MLSSTIKALHKLYPDDLSMPQQFQLLQNLTVLEQQFIAILPDNDAGLTSWQTLHRSLRTTIETTLANEAIAHRSKI